MANNHRILVAVDGAKTSQRTVAYVAEVLGGRSDYHVGLLHLQLPPRMLEWGGAEDAATEAKVSEQRAAAYEQMEKEAVAGSKAMLGRLQTVLTDRNIDVVAQEVRFEEPLDAKRIAQDIFAIAKEHNWGTIVVGRHSFAGLKRLFGQHVAETLLRTVEGVTIWIVE